MPAGGGYDGSDTTKNLLHTACELSDGEIRVNAKRAKPSFCSGATYLVLLEALGKGQQALLPKMDQKDGYGIFGRWNSNGPGSAKLVADIDAGENFTSWDTARPGDFLKIWWTEKIGGNERGHLVVYLGHDEKSVRFWSSNQPGGYGTKSVARNKCRRVLFTRITRPEKFAKAANLAAMDPWLARMLREDFTWQEVVAKCRVKEWRRTEANKIYAGFDQTSRIPFQACFDLVDSAPVFFSGAAFRRFMLRNLPGFQRFKYLRLCPIFVTDWASGAPTRFSITPITRISRIPGPSTNGISNMSPTWMAEDRFSTCPFRFTFPSPRISAARARVLKKRVAQSHLSARMESDMFSKDSLTRAGGSQDTAC